MSKLKEFYIKQAKPTWYKDILFRSKLEAAWARVFDLMDVEWEYEPCKFSWGADSYVPDFRVKIQGEEWFVEVKGYITPEWRAKLNRFMTKYHGTTMNFIIVGAVPWGSSFQKLRDSVKVQIGPGFLANLLYRAIRFKTRWTDHGWFVVGRDGKAKLAFTKEIDYTDVDTKRTTEIYNAAVNNQPFKQAATAGEADVKEQDSHNGKTLPTLSRTKNRGDTMVELDLSKIFSPPPKEEPPEEIAVPTMYERRQAELRRKSFKDRDKGGKKMPLPPKRERKNKRISLVMKPSVHEKVKAWAVERGISMNDLAEYAMLAYIESHE